jgi:hypothetical protein
MGGAGHIEGTCHCGAVHVAIELSRPASEVELRACQCSFCRRHGARTLTDEQGQALIAVRDPRVLSHYRFGLHTADYLICRTCGTYIAAVVDGRSATVNVGGLDLAAFRDRDATPVDYSAESAGDRLNRRRSRWMPIDIRIKAIPAARQKEACG